MQTLKIFSAICVMVLLAGVVSVRAETEAQAKAREALRQKMNELDAGKATEPARPPARKAPVTAPVTPPARKAPVAAPVTPPARRPVAAPQAQTPRAPAAVVPAASEPDSEAVVKARAALEQKMRELDSQKGVEQTPAPAPVVRQTPPTTPTPTQPAVALPVESEANQPDSEAVAKARAALDQKMKELQAQETVQKAPPTVKPGVQANVRPPAAYVPLEAPKSPISSSKEAQLAELLRKYRADEVSPEDYHKQRAAILAQ